MAEAWEANLQSDHELVHSIALAARSPGVKDPYQTQLLVVAPKRRLGWLQPQKADICLECWSVTFLPPRRLVVTYVCLRLPWPTMSLAASLRAASEIQVSAIGNSAVHVDWRVEVVDQPRKVRSREWIND